MQVKNISARGWWINGKMVAPGATEPVEATVADIGDNPDLVIVEDAEAVDPVSDIGEVVAEAQETKEVEQEKRKPGRPAK